MREILQLHEVFLKASFSEAFSIYFLTFAVHLGSHLI